MKTNIDLFPILQTSYIAENVDKNKDIRNVMLHLNSEVGEMNDWINRPWRQKEEFAGECADTIICVIDALYMQLRSEGRQEDLASILQEQIKKKTNKWQTNCGYLEFADKFVLKNT